MKEESLSRRYFVKQTIFTSASLLGLGAVIGACGNLPAERKDDSDASTGLNQNIGNVEQCEDFSGISEVELAKREQFGYVKETAILESKCTNCQLYIMPKEDQQCGGCMLFEGPVYDDAYCTYWAPQV